MGGESFFSSGSETADYRASGGQPLRFVILHHTGYGPVHWDWFFEEDEHLTSWRVYHDPTQPSKGPLALFRCGAHRVKYLDYEGPVSGGRGTVRRVATGTYRLTKKNSQHWRGQLWGSPLAGPFELHHEQDARWLLRADLWAVCEEHTR